MNLLTSDVPQCLCGVYASALCHGTDDTEPSRPSVIHSTGYLERVVMDTTSKCAIETQRQRERRGERQAEREYQCEHEYCAYKRIQTHPLYTAIHRSHDRFFCYPVCPSSLVLGPSWVPTIYIPILSSTNTVFYRYCLCLRSSAVRPKLTVGTRRNRARLI